MDFRGQLGRTKIAGFLLKLLHYEQHNAFIQLINLSKINYIVPANRSIFDLSLLNDATLSPFGNNSNKHTSRQILARPERVTIHHSIAQIKFLQDRIWRLVSLVIVQRVPTARLLVSNVIFPSGKLNINPDSKYGHVLVAATNTIQSVANGYGLLSSKFYDSQLVPKFE